MAALFNLILLLLQLAIVVFLIASLWTVYTKARKPGWASLIPIYNIIVLLEIVKKPWWWILLLLIPIANIVVAFLIMNALAESFGKGAGFAVGLLFLGFIFIPILAYTDARYQG